MRFKDAGFNLTEVLINFGPDSPKDTYCHPLSLYNQVWGLTKQLLGTNKVLAQRTV